MTTVLLIIQIMISIVLIGLILLQKSEGGALGIGGGGGGFMSGRSSATALVRATGALGTLFIVNCLALTVFFAMENGGSAFSGLSEDEALISTTDSSKDTIPLADETVTVPALSEPTEPEPTPPTDTEPTSGE